ncbi:WG repeat-containing protein, partial [Riemerella anatipestifer]|uniref:WG repeat-containing protein n=1 Tax=Riemerella anatipestifer TaxID=34085 RepID=UPI0030C01711
VGNAIKKYRYQMKILTFFISLIFLFSCKSQEQFQVIYLDEDYKTSYIADKNRNVIKKLDDSYGLNYRPETMGYFSIFSIAGEDGWTAIDINENKLFKVYNTEFGTPSPDDIIENRIRIVNSKGKIGFANKKGKIIIPPQFEMVSSFNKGKAIIAEKCVRKPWIEHPKENDCQHYSIECQKHGYINKKGKIIKFGNFTFEEIQNQINWEGQ